MVVCLFLKQWSFPNLNQVVFVLLGCNVCGYISSGSGKAHVSAGVKARRTHGNQNVIGSQLVELALTRGNISLVSKASEKWPLSRDSHLVRCSGPSAFLDLKHTMFVNKPASSVYLICILRCVQNIMMMLLNNTAEALTASYSFSKAPSSLSNLKLQTSALWRSDSLQPSL